MKLSESALNKMLVEAVNKGIIISENFVVFFSHHRIQKAVYKLITDEKRYLIHKNIALFMYNFFKENEDKNHLFEILFHYDKAFPVLQEEEILLLINLYKDAGVHAINKGAFVTAEKYLSKTISIANDISFDLHSQPKEIIFENRAKAYIMLKEFKKAEQDVDQLLSDVNCLTKKGRFCELALRIYTMSNQFEKGLHFGLNYLRETGLDIPEKLTLHYKKQLIKETNEFLKNDIGNLLTLLPLMTDETMQYAAIILCRLMPFFYYLKPDLIAITPCSSILLYRQYGQFITTPASLTTYAATLCHLNIQNYSLGFQLAETAENLCYQTNNQQLLSYVHKVRYGFISCWEKTFYHCMEKLNEGIRAGMETGDNEMAAYCHYNYAFFLFSSGTRLDDAINKYTDIVDNLKMLDYKEIISNTKKLLEMISQFSCASNQIDQSFKVNNIKNESNPSYQKAITSLVFHYFFHRYTNACNSAKQAMKMLNSVSGASHITLWLAFYGALSYLSLNRNPKNDDETCNYINLLESYFKKIPGLIDNKYFLVKAVELSQKKEYNTAIDYFDKAILISRQKKLIHEEALAHELASDTLSSLDISDFKTIRESLTVISQHTDKDKPFHNTLNLLIKISGSQKGLLFIKQNHMWEIVDVAEMHEKTNGNINDDKKQYANSYPESAINYVSHTKKHLILSHESGSDQLPDPYMTNHKIMSSLCMPLIARE